MPGNDYLACLEGDPLDYIAFSLHKLEEKEPARYQELHRHRLRFTMRPDEDGVNYSWALIGGDRRITHGKTLIPHENADSLPLRINLFLKNRGFFVDEASGFIH